MGEALSNCAEYLAPLVLSSISGSGYTAEEMVGQQVLSCTRSAAKAK